jgi:hypothetical protein
MKTIQSFLHVGVIVASLAAATGAQLRGGPAKTRQTVSKWQVTYDTSRACLPGKAGTVVATIKPTAGQAPIGRPTVVLKVAGAGTTYAQASRIQANGQAAIPLSTAAVIPPQGRRTNLVCTLRVGTALQKVACPVVPTCAPPPTPSPTSSPTSSPTPDFYDPVAPPSASPTHFDVLVPTDAPTPDVQGSYYDVQMNSGPVADPPSCLDAYLTVTVRHKGQPVQGRSVDLLVVANGSKRYGDSAITDANGQATFIVTLDPADQDANLWTSLAVENPLLPHYQQHVPALNFGC